MAYVNDTSASHTSLTSRIAGLFDRMVARHRQNRLFRETYNGLNALTNRELADLGLNRSELAYVAKQAMNR